MNILSAFDDLNLFRLVNFHTILSGDTLDLFWSNDPQRFFVYRSEKTYSDHDPIFAHLHVSGDDCFTPNVSKQMYSQKRFKSERFSCCENFSTPICIQIPKVISSPILICFFKNGLDNSCPKRVKDWIFLITLFLILFI